ncbi:MAG TPA: hypothetical protein DCL61_18715 [Cyanobacteria bacterium UBA12227]|nr:hypothetical protein [Cyanobacteria bacterium UBA12227]HAX89927.1 hypothetical protein [Cyanobacteria bacterium UBA11370]HBY80633.1 hypothetical protein [Cyanobacteria bacterium UBA11148]
MTNNQPKQKQLSKIDKFSIGTGLIGLVADVISLTSLFAISSDTKSAHLHIWLLVLLSIVYSIAAINFYARRYFHKRVKNNSQQFRLLEKATIKFTCLVGVPILICYSIFAFLEIDRVDPLLIDSLDFLFILADDTLRPIFCGVFYGGLLAGCTCYLCHYLMLDIYRAFDPSYRPTRFN